MKNERLFEALEKIDAELIDEAAPGKKPPKKKAKTATWVKWGTMAACVLVIIGIGMPLIDKQGEEMEETELAGNSAVITDDNKGVQEEAGEGKTNLDNEINHIEYGETLPDFTAIVNRLKEPINMALPNLREDIRTPMTNEELYEYYDTDFADALDKVATFEERESAIPKGIYTYADGSIFDMNQFVYYQTEMDYELCVSIGKKTRCSQLANMDADAQSSEINGLDVTIFRTDSGDETVYYAIFESGECDFIISGTNIEEDVFVKILGVITE